MLCSLMLGSLMFGAAMHRAPRQDAPSLQLLDDGEVLDARLAPPRTLNDALHPWSPPARLEDWEEEARGLRRQIQVASGLWPMPPKLALRPTIHGRIERDEYTVERVSFRSMPGHSVSGSLYRPRPGVGSVGEDGRRAAVLSPHGHWSGGRFHDAGAEAAARDRASSAERFEAAARHPLQARMVQLARMGCVVFHHDMVGYASSTALSHRSGFQDLDAVLRLHNMLGLQTFNSIRALDFLLSLEDVDPSRVGLTGASGGGTQSFVLGALDPRPAAAFPAVMVSTAMQGGCVCENASYFRLGTNNAAIAALFAPRPMALSGADDWTLDIEWRGLPQMREIWSLYGHPERVQARCDPQFGHNFSHPARARMATWFQRHLGLGEGAAPEERDFEPLRPADMEVFDDAHPLPADTLDAASLRAAWRERDARVLAAAEEAGDEAYRHLVGGALRVMIGPIPGPDSPQVLRRARRGTQGGVSVERALLGTGGGEAVPWVLLRPSGARRAVLWVDEAGKDGLLGPDAAWHPQVARWLAEGVAVASLDPLGLGEAGAEGFPPPIDERYPGYSHGYERPLLAERVRDVCAAMRALAGSTDLQRIDVVGTGEAGLWTLLARAAWENERRLAGWPRSAIDRGRVVADLQGFGFSHLRSAQDPRVLPGALRYGGLGGLAALAPIEALVLFGTTGIPTEDWEALLRRAARGNAPLRLEDGPLDRSIAARILR